MNQSDAKPGRGTEPAKGGCCGPDGRHDHAAHGTQSDHQHHQHDSGGAPKPGDVKTPADKPKAGHGSGCCCS